MLQFIRFALRLGPGWLQSYLCVGLFFLLGTSAHAAGELEEAQKEWLTADLYPEELHMDLSAGFGRAQKLVARSQGKSKALAMVVLARVQRLRRDFRSAQLTLEQAVRSMEGDYGIALNILDEMRLTELDRISLPWGQLSTLTDDMTCSGPDMDLTGTQYERSWQELTGKWKGQGYLGSLEQPSTLKSYQERSVLQSRWIDFSWRRGIVIDILMNVLESKRNDRERAGAMFQQQLADFSKNLASPSFNSARPAPNELARRQLILSLTVLQRGGGLPDLIAPHTCQNLETLAIAGQEEQALAALACAERGLFPGGRPEQLGLIVDGLYFGETTFGKDSPLWRRALLTKRWSDARHPQAERWLQLADSGFANLRNPRGSARVALVRGAAALARVLQARYEESAAQQAITLLGSAIEIATKAGDLRTRYNGLLLQGIAYALHPRHSERVRADGLLRDVLNHCRVDAEGDYGLGLGAARLLAAVAEAVAFFGHDGGSADLLSHQAIEFYRVVPAAIEGSQFAITRADVLTYSGATSIAEQTLQEAITSLPDSCKRDDTAKLSLAGTRALLLINQIPLHIAAMDNDRLRTDTKSISDWFKTYVAEREIPNMLAQVRKEGAAKAQEFADLLSSKVPLPPDGPDYKQRQDKLNDVLGRKLTQGRLENALFIGGLLPNFAAQAAVSSDIFTGLQSIDENPRLSLGAAFKRMQVNALKLEPDERRAMLALYHSLIDKKELARKVYAPEDETLSDDICTSLKPQGQGPSIEGGIAIRTEVDRQLRRTQLAVRIEDFAKADRLLKNLDRCFGNRTWHEKLQQPWEPLIYRAKIALGSGELRAALDQASEAIFWVEQHRADIFNPLRRQTFDDSSLTTEAYGIAALASARLKQPEETFRYLEGAKARILQQQILSEPGTKTQEVVELARSVTLLERQIYEHNCAGAVMGGARAAERREQGESVLCQPLLSDLKIQRTRYDEAFRKLTPEELRAPPKTQSLAIIKQALPADALLIDYLQTDHFLITLTVSRDEPTAVNIADLGTHELHTQIRAVRHHITALNPDLKQVAPQLNRLGQILLEQPTKGFALERYKRLFLSPHQRLHDLPFAVLPFGKSRFLVERFYLHLLPSIGLLTARAGGSTPLQTAGASIAILGSRSNLGQNGKAELQAVASEYALPASAIELNVAPERFIARLGDTDVVHVVAHGATSESRTERDPPRLWLDRAVTPLDLLLVPQRFRPRLVVLASCQLGLGIRTSGGENLSFPSVLLAKGVGGVVANLWDLTNSQHISSRMAQFHKRFTAAQGDAAVALAQMQRQAISDKVLPSEWAGLVLIGGRS